MGPVYCFPYQPSNTISLGDLKFYIGLQKVASEPLEHCDFVDPQSYSWVSPYHTKNNLKYLQFIFKVNTHRDRNIVVPTICALSKKNSYQIIHQIFDHASINRLKRMDIKGLM